VTTEVDRRAVTLFPAIDLRRGKCVRLEQGAPDRQTVYGEDPFAVATDFVERGAEWIHVVDLDAAFGDGSNRVLIRELARKIPVRIQTGGGYRSVADLEEIMDGPVGRVVIGTAAIESPDLVSLAIGRWGAERVAVGLDARGRTPAVRGWREESDEDLFDIALRLAGLGAATFIYTDISRDGMFAGPNIQTSVDLATATGAEVVVSGGVGSMADIEGVQRAAGSQPLIAGVIVGKAIYEGRVEVGEAVQALRR
jgi:phosphoribosylformimino-5-aminoimidazole carboxamide ribotide isomerase